MICKSIIFVVFAFVAHTVFDLSSATAGKLPPKAWANLDQIGYDEYETIVEEINGLKIVIELLRNLTVAIINDTQVEDLDTARVAASQQSIISAFDYSLNAIYKVAAIPCPLVETTRTTVHDNLVTGFTAIFGAIQTAQTGNYPANKADIESFGDIVKEKFTPDWFTPIRACLNPESRDGVESVIRLAEITENTALNKTFDAIFGAIEVYAAMVTDKNSHEGDTALDKIDSFQLVASEQALIDIGGYFAILDALYIDSYLNNTSIVYELYVTRYNWKITNYKLIEVVQIVFTQIVDLLKNKTSIIEEDTKYHYPSANATEVRAKSIIRQVTYNNILDTLQITQPSTATKVAAYKRVSSALEVIAVSSFYTSITKTRKQIARFVSAIALQNKESEVAVRGLFIVASRNNATTTIEREPEVDRLRAEAITAIQKTNNVIKDAIRFTNQDIHCMDKDVTQADFATIRKYQEQATVFITTFVDNMFREILEEVLASAGY